MEMMEARKKNGDIRATMFAKGLAFKGMQHENMNVECQDAMKKRSRDGIHVIVGCDGAGTARLARQGAEEMSNAWLEYLFDNEATLLRMSKTRAAEHMAQFTRTKLREFSWKYNCQEDDLASTAMAVIVDQNINRWMSLHLGDGMILRKHRSDTCFEILSMPEIGFLMNQTYLTSSNDLAKHIRIRQGNLGDLDSFAVITDGVYSCPLNVLHLTEKIDRFIEEEKVLPRDDDQGIAVIYQAKGKGSVWLDILV